MECLLRLLVLLDLRIIACVPVSHLWPPVLGKLVKAVKLIVKARKEDVFNVVMLGRGTKV